MKKKHYEISVIIPFHDVEMDVFEKGFASMRGQTLGFENIEWIVVIHNCAPRYQRSVHELLDGWENITVIDLENDRRTPSSPRNAGLAAASGDYVGFLDADDSFTPRCMEVALESIKRNRAQIAVFRREYELEKPDAVPFTEIVLWDQIEKEIVIDRENWDDVRMFTGAIGMVTSRIYDRQFLKDHGIAFDEEILFAEDYMFNLTAFGYADRVVYLPQFIGYHYYIHEGSLAQSGGKTREDLVAYAEGYVKIFDRGLENGFYMNSIISRLSFTLARFLSANTEISMEDRLKIRDLMAPYILKTTRMEPSKIYSAKAVKEMYEIPRRVILAPMEWAASKRQFLISGQDAESALDGSMTRTLSYILEKNQNTDMGRHYAFWEILTLEDYRRKVPVSTYEDFGPLVQLTTRIGESGIFTSEEIAVYVMHKPGKAAFKDAGHEDSHPDRDGQLFPVTRRQVRANARAFSRLLKGLRTVLLPDAVKGGMIRYNDAVYAATMAGTVTAALFSNMYGILRPNATAPQELFFAGEGYDTRYIHLLFALKDRGAEQIIQPKIRWMLRFFSYIEENWRVLCDDIEHGTVSVGDPVPDSLSDTLRHSLTPDPVRAEELRAVFGESPNGPLAPRIWKKLRAVYTNAGGSDEDLGLLQLRYLGETPCRSMYYETCGTVLGIGEWRGDQYGLKLLSQAAFVEFIPMEDLRAASPRVLTKDETAIGELYEPVITTAAGLYRFRTHDMIRITALDQDDIWFEAAQMPKEPGANA